MGDRVALHSLLEKFNHVQKKDIHDVAKGHLNENKLRRKDAEVKDNFWASATKDPIWTRQKVLLTNHPTSKKSLPPIEKKDVDKSISAASNDRSKTKRSGTEQIFYPDTMIPNPFENGQFSKDFVPSHLLFATKDEQYKQFKKSGRHLILPAVVPPEEQEKCVQVIEKKMRQDLQLLEAQSDCSVPNYFKFKVYSDAWEHLNDLLPRESVDNLRPIKKDYDHYVNVLLEEQLNLNQQHPLMKEDESLEEYHKIINSKHDSDHVMKQEDELHQLEDQLLNELKENKKLRKKVCELDKEEDIMLSVRKVIPPVEIIKDDPVVTINSEFNLNDVPLQDLEGQVIALHVQIEEKYHEIKKIKKIQREEYVPRPVFQKLEQSIKEIEVETQKLLKQNDFLEHDIQELEEELEELLEKTGCKNTESGRLIWDITRGSNW